MPPPNKRPDRSEVLNFDQNKLHHVDITEKVVLPSKEGKVYLRIDKGSHWTILLSCQAALYFVLHSSTVVAN